MTDTITVPQTKAFQGLPTQKEVNYLPLSATKGKACANCRWFLHFGGCFIVDGQPEPILPTGYCDRWEATPQPEPAPDVAEVIAESVGEAVEAVMEAMPLMPMEMSHEHESSRAEVIIDPAAPVLTQLQNRLRRQPLKDGTQVLKDNTGRRYMFMITSNGYRDRDNANVTTRAIEDYVEKCWTDDGQFIGDNAHYIWHTKELGSISDLVFADVWSGFLVELWREKEQMPVAKAFYNYVERHPDEKWGASQGFFASKTDIDAGLYKTIAKYESSSLPLAAASNVYTLSEVLPMVEKSKRDTFLNQLFKEEFGIEDAAALLKQGPETLRKTLADRGVEAKTAGGDAIQKARLEASKQNAELLLSMVEVQDEFDRQLSTLTETQTKAANDEAARIAAIEKKYEDRLAAVEKDNQALRTLLNQAPRRASQDSATTVTDDDKQVLKDALPAGDKEASFWGVPASAVKPKS